MTRENKRKRREILERLYAVITFPLIFVNVVIAFALLPFIYIATGEHELSLNIMFWHLFVVLGKDW